MVTEREGLLGEIVGTAVSKRNYPNERHRRSLRLQGYDYSEPPISLLTVQRAGVAFSAIS